MILKTLSYIILISVLLINVAPVLAQMEITQMYDLSDTSYQSGDIVAVHEDGMVLAKSEYDSKVFGVIQTDPLAVYRRIDGSGVAISRSGDVSVNVTNANGAIKKGDFVTTSSNAGKGQKATATGYVLGVALDDLEGSEGKILVAVRIEFAEITTARSNSRLLDSISAALLKNTKDPALFVNIIKYVGVSVIDLMTIMIGLFILARVIPKGVEGIGRNPTAKHSIIVYTIVNLGIVALVVFLGVGLSLFLLRI